MIEYVRSLFGLGQPSSERKVVGSPVAPDQREVAYIRESNARLNQLHNLASKYRGTPHEDKIKIVFEKTKNIHAYLVTKRRTQDLELFHIRNTDHFLSTFTVILEAHQKPEQIPMPPPPPELGPNGQPESKADTLLRKFKEEQFRRSAEAKRMPEMVQAVPSPGAAGQPWENRAEVPRLAVPDVSINTFAKIIYLREDSKAGHIANEIGFTSTKEEKEAFLLNVSARLGINIMGMSYFGNAILTIPNSSGSSPTGYVPIIQWKGYMYALNLNDYRLFPVRIFRKSP